MAVNLGLCIVIILRRMPGEKSVKNLLYGELSEGTRKVGRPFLRLKNTMKDILKRGGILDTWRGIVTDRVEWRKLISNGCAKIDNDRQEDNKGKRQKRNQNIRKTDICFIEI